MILGGSPIVTPQTVWRGQQPETTIETSVPLSRDMNAEVDTSLWSTMNVDIAASNHSMQNSISLNPSDVDPWGQLDMSSLFGLQMNDSLMERLESRDSTSFGDTAHTEYSATLEIPMQTDASGDGISEMPLFSNMATDECRESDESAAARLSATSALIDLSRLNESIARQLSELSSYPWRSPQMEKYCSEKSHIVAGNPIAQALQSTARFIIILRGLVSSCSSSPHDSHPTTPIPTPSSDSGISVASLPLQNSGLEDGMKSNADKSVAKLSIPILLLIISTHLQQLQLWNSLLSRAYELLRILPEEVFESFRAPSDFHVTGLPGMRGRLYGKILIHIVQDQLSSVDRLLALPAEFRLNAQTSMSQPEDIFSDSAFSDILHIAMTQIDNTRKTTGARLVVSLRETLRRVLDVLSN